MSAPSRPIAWLLLLVMGWAGVWCCCTPATAAVPAAATPHRSCCDTEPKPHAAGRSCPMPASDACPILKLREASIAASPTPAAVTPPVLIAFAAWPAFPPASPQTGPAFLPLATAAPPCPTTLLSLHTALRC